MWPDGQTEASESMRLCRVLGAWRQLSLGVMDSGVTAESGCAALLIFSHGVEESWVCSRPTEAGSARLALALETGPGSLHLNAVLFCRFGSVEVSLALNLFAFLVRAFGSPGGSG